MRETFACGENYFGQLGIPPGEAGQDSQPLNRFRKVRSNYVQTALDSLRSIWAGWNHTSVQLDDTTIALLGHQARHLTIEPGSAKDRLPQQTASLTQRTRVQSIGDYTGLLALLRSDGTLFLPTQAAPSTPLKPHNPNGPLLSHLATSFAGGATAAIPLQAPAATVFHVLTWPSFACFTTWHADPSNPSHAPTAHHTLPGAPAQLLAHHVAFALRTRAGLVYTWGDARWPVCLARDAPADTPAVVDALAGVPITRIDAATGGWAFGAASEAGEAWVWGFGGPGERWLESVGPQIATGVFKVVLPSLQGDGEERDVLAVAMGAYHALALDGSGGVWSIGRDTHGQLGLGVESGEAEREMARRLGEIPEDEREARLDFVQREMTPAVGKGVMRDAWTAVPLGGSGTRKAVDVAAGRATSFVVVE